MWWLGIAFAFSPVEAIRVGDCGPALAGQATTDGERLWQGICRVRVSDFAGAEAALAAVTAAPFEPYARWQRAEAAAGAGDPQRGLSLLDGLSLPGTTALAVRLTRARLLIADNRSLDARDDLRALLETSVHEEARFLLAEGARARGDHAAAIPTYRKTWSDSQTGPWSARAAARLAELGAPVDRLDTPEALAAVERRAIVLGDAQRHAEALVLWRQLRAGPATVPDDRFGRALFRGRAYAEAADLWARTLGAPDAATGDADALFDYAVAATRAGRYDDALRIYRRLLAQHPDDAKGDFASFKLGYLEYDRRNCDAARQELTRHVAARPKSTHADEALWFAARCAHRQADDAASTGLWRRLIEQYPASELVPSAKYWTVRVGPEPEREAGYADVLNRWPESGAAWFAAWRLDRTWAPRDIPELPAPPDAWRTDARWRAALDLLQAGYTAWAADHVQPLIASYTGRSSREDEALASVLLRVGAIREARRLVAARCPTRPPETPTALERLCRPRPERDLLEPVAERWELTPLLPNAIMLAESAFDAHVTSPAGARGLMQLMPERAAAVQPLVFPPSSPVDADNLYRAAYNATLGTTELGRLGRVFANTGASRLPATIAAYNAGEEPVRRWLAESPGAEADEFAEDIGYTETRDYVRRVLGYLMGYRRTYGDPQPS